MLNAGCSVRHLLDYLSFYSPTKYDWGQEPIEEQAGRECGKVMLGPIIKTVVDNGTNHQPNQN